VYALGVILYVLVTGQFPYDVVGGMRRVVDSIVSAEPARPGSFKRGIDHDLETVIIKSLSKERERRYESAGELARELRRFLAGEPIVARGDSTWYVLTKTVRRHRAIAGALLVLLVLVVAYAVTTTILLSRARIAERRAEASALDARAKFRMARDGMAFVVGEVSQKLSRVGGAGQVRQSVLEAAYKQLAALANERSDDPGLQADLARSHYEVGDLALAIGNRGQANEHFETALKIRKEIAEANPDDEQAQVELSLAHVRLGDVAKPFGDRPRSEEQYEQALRIDEALSHAHPHNLHYLDNLFWSHFRLGWAAYERNDVIGARHHLELSSPITERLVSLEPRNPTRLLSKRDWSVLAGFLAAMDHDWEGTEQYRLTAVATSEELVELEPENPLFRFRLACAYEGQSVIAGWRHRFDEVDKWRRAQHEILERLVSEDPLVEIYQVALIRSNVDLATSELDRDNPERAVTVFLESFYQVENRLKELPNDATLQRTLLITAELYGRAHERLGTPENARSITETAIQAGQAFADNDQVAPDVLDCFANLLLVAIPANLQDPERALQLSLLANERHGVKNRGFLFTLALAHCRTGDTEAARAVFAEVMEMTPDSESGLREDFANRIKSCLP